MSRTSLHVIIALASAAVGYALYQSAIAPRSRAAAELDAPPGNPMSTEESQSTDAGLPATLPEVSLPDRDGNMRSITSWTGKSMIVNFWATWCAPCRREIPLLNQIQQLQTSQGFQVIGIAVDARDEVLDYAEANTIDYPVLIGEEAGIEAASKLGQGSLGLPLTAFTDRQHRVVATHAGELTKPQADAMIELIGRLNRGELTLEAARAQADEKLQALEG